VAAKVDENKREQAHALVLCSRTRVV
jgi:hypothetical protein